MKISGVYQIINKITGDFYIGSSIDLKKRKKEHFSESTWKQRPNKPLYKDMKQYGKDRFLFRPIWLCNPNELKKYEQIAIDKYNPKYNVLAAYTGMTREEYIKQWYKENADRKKQYQKQYRKENADRKKQQQKQYFSQQCLYENELLSLNALRKRFAKKGIKHSTLEAKKYLIQVN